MEGDKEKKGKLCRKELSLWKRIARVDCGEEDITDEQLLEGYLLVRKMCPKLKSGEVYFFKRENSLLAYIPELDNELDRKYLIVSQGGDRTVGRSLHTKGKEFNTTLNTLPEETFGARWKEICNCCGELNASNKCSCKEKDKDDKNKDRNMPVQVDLPQNNELNVNGKLPPDEMQPVVKMIQTSGGNESAQNCNAPSERAGKSSKNDQETQNPTVPDDILQNSKQGGIKLQRLTIPVVLLHVNGNLPPKETQPVMKMEKTSRGNESLQNCNAPNDRARQPSENYLATQNHTVTDNILNNSKQELTIPVVLLNVNGNLPPQEIQPVVEIEKTNVTNDSAQNCNAPDDRAGETSENDQEMQNLTVPDILQSSRQEGMQRQVEEITNGSHVNKNAGNLLDDRSARKCSSGQHDAPNPSVVESVVTSQNVNCHDILRKSKETIRNLIDENRKFKEVIKDPYCRDESNDGEENNEELNRKRFRQTHEGGDKLPWNDSDTDVSFGDTSDQQKNDIPEKKPKRVQWSEDEMDYIRDGVRRFGVGDWAQIRDYYPFVEAHKSSVSIKDKYRNMLKNGQM